MPGGTFRPPEIWRKTHCSLRCPGTEVAAPCATRLKRKEGSPETRVTNCADQEMVLSPSISFTHVSEKPQSFGKNKQTKIHWTNPQSAFCHFTMSSESCSSCTWKTMYPSRGQWGINLSFPKSTVVSLQQCPPNCCQPWGPMTTMCEGEGNPACWGAQTAEQKAHAQLRNLPNLMYAWNWAKQLKIFWISVLHKKF